MRAVPSAKMVFVGLVAPWSGIEEVLEFLTLLRQDRPEIHLTILGPSEPAYAGLLKERIASFELTERVDWRGDRPRDEVAAALAEAGIGLATFRPHPLRIHAAPLKLLEYLATGLPVIALKGSAAGDMVITTRTGVTCATTGAGIADAVRRLMADPAAYEQMSAKGPKVAADHDWKVVLTRESAILAELDQLIPGGGAVLDEAG